MINIQTATAPKYFLLAFSNFDLTIIRKLLGPSPSALSGKKFQSTGTYTNDAACFEPICPTWYGPYHMSHITRLNFCCIALLFGTRSLQYWYDIIPSTACVSDFLVASLIAWWGWLHQQNILDGAMKIGGEVENILNRNKTKIIQSLFNNGSREKTEMKLISGICSI